MQKSIKDLKGNTIVATDGDIGKAADFYFDDKSWTIRYLVADTGNWLLGRKVLISPIALGEADFPSGRFNVTLTKKQVEDSPSIDADKSVSRQHEAYYHDYYGYPYYWPGPYLWGPMAYPRFQDTTQRKIEERRAEREEAGDLHLRSANTVTGYHIEATDGDIGHVEDFIVDDESWEIRYMVVDTRNWLPGKKVLIAPRWIDRVSWEGSKVYISLTRESIKNAPEYHPDALNREYEEKLHDHYHRPKYWDPPFAGPRSASHANRIQGDDRREE
ncbi:MAG: PRC-barrel domain-containing protein [Candidatus Binatia bacterium]